MCDVQYTSFRTIETKGTVVGKNNTDTDIIFDDLLFGFLDVQDCIIIKSYLVLFNIKCETIVVIS